MLTQYYTACSLDGFIATPDDSLDWLHTLDATGSTYDAFIADVGAIAMGSHTYEWVSRALAASGDPWPYEQPTWVFTTRPLKAPDGIDVRFVRGDVRSVHMEMVAAAGGRNVWVAGGGDLVGQFLDAGLLDELIVQVAPVTLGAGKPLLPRRADFVVTSTQRFGEFVEIRLRPRR